MLEKGWQDLRLMHQAPFLLIKDLSNANKCKGWGHLKRVCPSCLNYMRRGNARKWNTPPLKPEPVETPDSNYKRDPMIANSSEDG